MATYRGAESDAALTDFAQLRIERWPSADVLRRRIIGLRHNLSAYEAAYVGLAEALECPLVTRDRRLEKASSQLIDVRVL